MKRMVNGKLSSGFASMTADKFVLLIGSYTIPSHIQVGAGKMDKATRYFMINEWARNLPDGP